MKSKNLLPVLAASLFMLCFTACKKTTPGGANDATTNASLSVDMAISDNISEDANNSTIGATATNHVDARPTQTQVAVYCFSSAGITDTLTGNFGGHSKAIDVNFDGSGSCQGVTRTGQIVIILSDSLRKAGSTATLIFKNYYANGYKREGKIVWTNITSPDSTNAEWTREDSGKVTAPNLSYWFVSGSRTVEETSFGHFSILSGTRTVRNAAGASITATVLTTLTTRVGCPFIESGDLQLTDGTNNIVVDYGFGTSDGTLTGTANESGACDDLATYTLNGGTAFPFYLGQ